MVAHIAHLGNFFVGKTSTNGALQTEVKFNEGVEQAVVDKANANAVRTLAINCPSGKDIYS